MNVILFTTRRAWQRRIDLGRPVTAIVAACALTLVIGCVFAAGFVAAMWHADHTAANVSASLQAQRKDLGDIRGSLQEQLDALAVRVGQVQAHVIRLNVLGERLTQMANLDDGEFNFSEAPALGGPEEPLTTSHRSIGRLVQDLERVSNQLDDREAQLDVLESLLMTRDLQAQVYPDGMPVDAGWISSYFGERADPFNGHEAVHHGIDFAGRDGASIKAIAAGVVSFSDVRHGYGNCVEINHGNGYVTRYAHNRVNLVAAGDRVEKGQIIALMGTTGRATGPNLHFEVLHYGKAVNPIKYVNRKTG
jgi:murein DD-endopeptidase MepM/ murein hydrolase activator NlpD